MNGISPETFKNASSEVRERILFDLQYNTHNMMKEHIEKQTASCISKSKECDAKFKKLGRWKVVNASLTLVGSFFGGIAAVFAKIKFFG